MLDLHLFVKKIIMNNISLREKINLEIDYLKSISRGEVYASDVAKKFNASRQQIGRFFSERNDMVHKRKYNFESGTVSYWMFE